jgi:lipopolysaccharide/colanic/teichoic acid biosynthesis glycosyltransferase
MYLVYRQDKQSPFYLAPRVGKNGKIFKMIKLRSMVINADKNGVDSTSADDSRITPIGVWIRKFKLDEFTQLINVLSGEMSLVGPRPNVKMGGTDLYTDSEKRIITIKPGITDFSSIVFSDEGDILSGKSDPDLSYNQLIRPWKSRLALLYIDNQSNLLDLKIIFYTAVAMISKTIARGWVGSSLQKMTSDENIVAIVKREIELYPFAPPGAAGIVEELK